MMRYPRAGIVAMAWALLALGAASAVAQEPSAAVLLERAQHVERVEGDLQRAIGLYQHLLAEHPDDRVVAAKAQLQIGICYETLGRAEAERAYRRVIDRYADRAEEVAVARRRLAGLARAVADRGRGPTFTRIAFASTPHNGVLSPDGERLAFVSGGGVWIAPLHGNVDPTIAGEPVRVADIQGAWDNASQLAWSRDGRWIAVNGKVDSADAVYVVPADGGAPRAIGMPERGGHAYSYRLSLSPDGGALAFSALGPNQVEGRNDTQKRFIYSVPVSGGEPRQLTDMWGRLPAFSPDGETIAYVSHRQRDTGAWESDLWLVPASGGEPTRIVSSDSGRIRGPVWSPDGRFIAAHHEPGLNNFSDELWIIPVESADRGASPIKIRLPDPSWNMLAGWTPDDRLGVFMTTPEEGGFVYTVPAAGGRAVQITPEVPGGRPSYLSWSPAGDRIYAQVDTWGVPGAMTHTLASVAAEGGRIAELPGGSSDAVSFGVGISISPDGRRIAFMGIDSVMTRGRRPTAEETGIWTVGVNGGGTDRLTSGPTYDAYPSWSPDGRWIAFLRTAGGGRWNVCVVAAEGGDVRQVTSDADSTVGGRIAFSPDGTQIAFFARGAVKAISTGGGNARTLFGVRGLGSFPELAWSPDGAMIAYTAGSAIRVDRLSDGTRSELTTGLPQGLRYSSVTWSPDGERIAFVAWRPSEIGFWLMSDFLPRH